MAESPPHSPWFETLKGIATTTGRDSLSDRPRGLRTPSHTRSGSGRRVSPVHGDVEAGAGKVKTIKSECCDSQDYSTGSLQSSFSFSRGFSRSGFPLGLEEPQNSPDVDLSAKDNGFAVQPTKETSPSPPPPPPSQNASKVLPLGLPPPPAISSPVSYSKSFQLPAGIKDFYFEPSTKYDLGPEKKPSRCRRCCYCVLTIIFLLLVVLGIGVAVLAVKLNPKKPSLTIGDGLTFTSLNYSKPGGVPQLELGLHFTLNLSNLNKHAKVIYSNISATVYYNNTLALSTVDIPGFVQGFSNTTQLTSGNLEQVTNVPADTAVGLSGEVASSNVELDLTGIAGGKFQILWFKVEPFSVAVNCQLNVKPGAVGQQAQIISSTC